MRTCITSLFTHSDQIRRYFQINESTFSLTTKNSFLTLSTKKTPNTKNIKNTQNAFDFRLYTLFNLTLVFSTLNLFVPILTRYLLIRCVWRQFITFCLCYYAFSCSYLVSKMWNICVYFAECTQHDQFYDQVTIGNTN